jgi:hypothetical protein
MPCKIVLYYNQLNAGFSETYYHVSDDPVTLAQNFTSAFYNKMVSFRSSDTVLEAARFSSTVPPRKSFLIRPYPKPQGTSGTTGDIGPDVVSTTAVFALQNSDGSTRRIYMRGLADQDVKRDTFGNDIPSAGLRSGTDKMFLELFKQGFSIRRSNRPPNAGLTWQNIVLVGHTDNTNPDSSYFVLDTQVIQFAKNDVLQFNGVPSDLPRFPRKTIITGVVLDGGVQKYYFDYGLPGGVQVATSNMKATKSTYSLAVISQWQFERFSEHKTGRPFGSLRGRARAV